MPKCECEHKSHFDGMDGHLYVHEYGARKDDVREVLTDYGRFAMCGDCASSHDEHDGHGR